MLKQNKGITLSALVLTVVLLIIITGISLTAGTDSIKEVRIGRLISNMTLLQTKTQEVYESNQFNEDDLVGKKVNKYDIKINEAEREIIENSEDMWYKWEKADLNLLGFDKNMLGNNEYYLVNYKNNEIYYSKGTKHKGEFYYTLTGLKSIYQE